MIRAGSLNPFLLLTIFTIFSFCSRCCTAQNNNINNTARNECETYARCGAFGSCNSQVSPICSCMQGFEPQNKEEWDSGNWTTGCVRKVPLNCHVESNSTSTDGFLKLQMIKVPGYSQHLLRPENMCAGLCLMNCSCVAYTYNDDRGCMFWNSTLFDVQKFRTGLVYFRVAISELDHKKDIKKIIIALVIIGIIIMSICMYVSWEWMAKRKVKRPTMVLGKEVPPGSVDTTHQNALSIFNLEDLPLFKFEILAVATDNFSHANKLGEGGFGHVYKGELINGREIAVKRLSKASGQGMHEFMNEVVLISKLQHRNLVKLLGCCIEDNEKMLIYEYMPNKSLDSFLFDQSQGILDWKKRLNIIEGICRGLLYLHRDSRLKIIHRDLKPSNILLDSNWNPKISDFGMARIFGSNQDHIRTIRVVGTYGYMAPEYAIQGTFSEKSDVFSFGVLMLEIVSGKRNTSFYNHRSSLNLLGHVWNLWTENNIVASIDVKISSPRNQAEAVRCMHIGLLCVQELPKDRPTISTVLSMLSSETMELPKPKQAAFALNSSRCGSGTISPWQNQMSNCSLNNVTLSVVDGR